MSFAQPLLCGAVPVSIPVGSMSAVRVFARDPSCQRIKQQTERSSPDELFTSLLSLTGCSVAHDLLRLLSLLELMGSSFQSLRQ